MNAHGDDGYPRGSEAPDHAANAVAATPRTDDATVMTTAPLADSETLTSSMETSKGMSLIQEDLIPASAAGGDTIVDSEPPSLPTDGVPVATSPQIAEAGEPVSLSDISLTLVKQDDELPS